MEAEEKVPIWERKRSLTSSAHMKGIQKGRRVHTSIRSALVGTQGVFPEKGQESQKNKSRRGVFYNRT